MLSSILKKTVEVLRLVRRERSFSIKQHCEKYNIEPRGILHLGANDGGEAELYQRCGFRQVAWVEGYEPFFDRLRRHVEAFPGQKAYRVLISDKDGEEVHFRVADNGVSSTALTPAERFHDEFPSIVFVDDVPLTARRLDRYFSENHVDLSAFNFLIVDLEGSELKALRSLGDSLRGFEWAGIEIRVGEDFVSGPTLSDIDAHMMANGFKRIETVMGSSSGDALYHRQIVTPLDKFQMVVSSAWLEYGYYRLYRNMVVKTVKRFMAES